MSNRGIPRWASYVRIGLVILCLTGIYFCGQLAIMSAPTTTTLSGFASRLCEGGQRLDCRHVLRSDWANVRGISLTHFGLAYFGLLAAWYIGVGVPNRKARAWHLVPIALTVTGFAVSLCLIYVMAFRLRVGCPGCLAVHATNLLLLIGTLFTWPRAAPRLSAASGGASGGVDDVRPYPSPGRAVGILGGSLAVLAFAALGLFAVYARFQLENCSRLYHDATNDVEYIAWMTRRSPVRKIPIRPDDPAFGPADAPHTLVAFTDFQCPHCLVLDHYADQLVRRFPDKLRIVFKYFPVSSECNRHVKNDLHPFACEAARASEAARITVARSLPSPSQRVATSGPADPMAPYHAFCSLLFQFSDRLAERPYETFARECGIDVQTFDRVLADGLGRDRIEEDIDLGEELGVTGSGVVFLDGRRMPDWQITSNPSHPQIDVAGTVALWERLLSDSD